MLDKWMKYATHDECLIVWNHRLVLFPYCYGWVEPEDLYILYIKYFWSNAVSKHVKFNTNSDLFFFHIQNIQTYIFHGNPLEISQFHPSALQVESLSLTHFKELCHAWDLFTVALVLRPTLRSQLQLQDTHSIVQVPQCGQAPGYGSVSFCTIFPRNTRNVILLIP